MNWRPMFVLLLSIPATAAAQDGLFLTAGRVLAGQPDEASWRLTLQRDLIGPIGIDFGAQVLPGERPQPGRLYGIEADITLFADARRLPTFFFGGGAGIGQRDQDQFWFSSSVGLRVPMLVLGPMRASIEGRWRMLSVANRDGFELGVTVGWRRPTSPAATTRGEAAGLWVPLATGDGLRAAGIPADKARLLGGVVSTALEEMGQPYIWGGTGDGTGGFDCSGLIYYAYGRHGLRIPRTSEGQARAGIAIRREFDLLLPGDILTFSESGGAVTHVGLYVGDGRFIHSASKGVRVSRLSEDDPDGRWWLRRWMGVRRVVE